MCHEFAERNGYIIVHEYIDRAVSGKNWLNTLGYLYMHLISFLHNHFVVEISPRIIVCATAYNVLSAERNKKRVNLFSLRCDMVTRKEDTPQRVANRKYEAKNKEKRQAASGNFQTMIPRELFEEISLPYHTSKRID